MTGRDETLPLDASSQPYKPGTLLLVTWEDSATESNSLHWMGGKDLKDALESEAGVVTCTTVGFLVHESRRTLTLCQNYSDSNCVSHVLHIPRSAVLTTEALIEPEDEPEGA